MNRSLLTVMLVMLLFVGSALAEAPAGSKVLLRLNLEVGDQFSYRNISHQIISQDIMGMNQVIDQTVTTDYAAEVTEKISDLYSIRFTYTRTQFVMDGGAMMGTVSYDSDAEQDGEVEAAARSYAAMIGQSFVAKVNSGGEVESLEGLDDMLEAMIKEFEDLPQEEKDAIRSSLDTQFGQEGMISNVQAFFLRFPEKKVKRGYTWDSSRQQKSGFSINIATKNVLEAVTDTGVVVNTTSTQVSDPGFPMEFSGMTLNYDIKGTGEGSQTIDPTSGMLIRSQSKQSLAGEVTATGGMMGNGMTWPITIESTNTYEAL